MGHETEARGEQAGGWLVLASDSSGHVTFGLLATRWSLKNKRI